MSCCIIHMCTSVRVHMHLEAGAQPEVTSLGALPSFFEMQSLTGQGLGWAGQGVSVTITGIASTLHSSVQV